MSGSSYKGTAGQSSTIFRANIGSYGASTDFFGAIFRGCQFNSFNARRLILLDAMAGPGKLGKDIRAKYKIETPNRAPLSIFFNDVRAEPLLQLRREARNNFIINCDAKEIDKSGRKFHIFAVRCGLKDLPQDQLPLALSAAYNSILPGGRIVIGDMMAYTSEGQNGIIRVHSAKQEFAGRNREQEGICFIPTAEEWAALLLKTGFSNVRIETGLTSNVETSQWKGQFGTGADDQAIIRELNSIIQATAISNPVFAREFNVRFDGEKTLIDFPIMVASAEKTV